MRWHELFADLEAQARSLERACGDGEIAERTRGEVATVTLVNRLHAQLGRTVTVSISGVGDMSGQLQRVGADWFLVAGDPDAIVPLSAVMALTDLPPEAVSSVGVSVVSANVGLTSALRAVARDRGAITLVRRDGKSLTGTPDRVGADFVDVALHDVDGSPRRNQVRTRVTVGFEAIGCVRRRPTGWD